MAADFIVSVASLIVVYSLFTLGLNIKFGFAGLIDFGHVLYFMIGAYVSTVLTAPAEMALYQGIGGFNLPALLQGVFPLAGFLGWLLGVVGGIAAAVIVALLIGLLTIQLREDYLAIASLGIAAIGHTVFNNVRWLFNGTFGIRNIYAPFQSSMPLSVGSRMLNITIFGGLSVAVLGYLTYLAYQQVRRLSLRAVGIATALVAVLASPFFVVFARDLLTAGVGAVVALAISAVLAQHLRRIDTKPVPFLVLLVTEVVLVFYFGTAAVNQGLSQVVRNALWLYDPTATAAGGIGYDRFFLLLSASFLAIGYWFAETLVKSPYGRVLVAIREDEDVAKVLGKNTFLFKVETFAIGSAMAAAAGSLYAVSFGYIDPSQFGLIVTFYAYAAIFLGGVANNKGSVIGMTIFWTLFTGTRFLADFFPPGIATQLASLRVILIGLVIIAMVYFKPDGLLGEQSRSMKEHT